MIAENSVKRRALRDLDVGKKKRKSKQRTERQVIKGEAPKRGVLADLLFGYQNSKEGKGKRV